MSVKPDIVELYGLPPVDAVVADRLVDRTCPFTRSQCIKIVRGSSNPTGVCAVTAGATKTPVVVCPNRFHGDNHAVLRMVAMEAFGVAEFIIGGGIDELEDRLISAKAPSVVALGDNSGDPIEIMGRTKIGFDWILQNYTARRKRLGFVGVEIRTVEMGGNFRDCRDAYKDFHGGRKGAIPASEHTLDWSGLQKKFLPEMIQKALVVSNTPDCQGFFVILPDIVYQRLSDVLLDLPEQDWIGADIISFRTYSPDAKTASGVRGVRAANYKIRDVVAAYFGRPDEKASKQLAKALKDALQ